jgi:hypothetical protein
MHVESGQAADDFTLYIDIALFFWLHWGLVVKSYGIFLLNHACIEDYSI